MNKNTNVSSYKKSLLLQKITSLYFSSVALLLGSFLMLSPSWAIAPSFTKCVQIYYDKIPQDPLLYYEGRYYALMLQNLLGHFPHIQQYIIPIESYKAQQLDRCKASLYISSHKDNAIPATFLKDFVATQKNVAWIGLNINTLSKKSLNELWGVQYKGQEPIDLSHRDAQGVPGFYKFYDYKGETFENYGKFNKEGTKFIANSAITVLTFTDLEAKKNVISWARHSTKSDQRTPFILRKTNHWYVANIPFDYITFDSNYLIFSDLLFDILEELPLYKGKKPAYIRVEDVNAGITTPAQIRILSELFELHHIPFSISLVPIFADPLMVISKDPEKKYLTLLDNPGLLQALHFAVGKGASILMHGVTHQYKNIKNPFNGVTASDYEFWDANANKPIPEDNVEYVINRLAQGVEILEKAELKLSGWLTPHYHASPLDYTIFGQVFNWNIGQVVYIPHHTSQKHLLPASLTFEVAGAKNNAMRLAYLKDLKVQVSSKAAGSTEILPYEIYGDVYGQRIIPENIGNIQPYLNNQVVEIRRTQDIIKTIKRNRVLRDVWASYFIHPFLINKPKDGGIGKHFGETSELENLLEETKNAGYEFIDLKNWIKNTNKSNTLPAIEIDPPLYK